MIFDDALINEDARGSAPGINEDGVVRRIDGVNYESVRWGIVIEQQIRVLICKVCRGAVQIADDAGVRSAFGRKDGIIGAREDVVGLKVEAVKG